MHPDEYNNCVYISAKFGASYEMDQSLFIKVKADTGDTDSIRLIAAVTMYHIWLLKGKPDKKKWQYRERVKYTIEVLTYFKSLPSDDRANMGPAKSSAILN